MAKRDFSWICVGAQALLTLEHSKRRVPVVVRQIRHLGMGKHVKVRVHDAEDTGRWVRRGALSRRPDDMQDRTSVVWVRRRMPPKSKRVDMVLSSPPDDAEKHLYRAVRVPEDWKNYTSRFVERFEQARGRAYDAARQYRSMMDQASHLHDVLRRDAVDYPVERMFPSIEKGLNQ